MVASAIVTMSAVSEALAAVESGHRPPEYCHPKVATRIQFADQRASELSQSKKSAQQPRDVRLQKISASTQQKKSSSRRKKSSPKTTTPAQPGPRVSSSTNTSRSLERAPLQPLSRTDAKASGGVHAQMNYEAKPNQLLPAARSKLGPHVSSSIHIKGFPSQSCSRRQRLALVILVILAATHLLSGASSRPVRFMQSLLFAKLRTAIMRLRTRIISARCKSGPARVS